MKYRLLDDGECWGGVAGCEILTVSAGWRSAIGYGTVQAHTAPMRRPDDGNGKYLLCGSIDGTELWKWGVGWVKWDRVEANLPSSVTIWRKEREVDQAQLKNEMAGRPWVTFCEEEETISYFTTEKEALDYIKGDELVQGQHYHIAKIVKTVVVKMIVKEVAQ